MKRDKVRVQGRVRGEIKGVGAIRHKLGLRRS